jgi:hypothetical protein
MSRRNAEDSFFNFEDDGTADDEYGDEYDERTMLDDDYGEERMDGANVRGGPLSGLTRVIGTSFSSFFTGVSWVFSVAKPFVYYGWLPLLSFLGLKSSGQPLLALLLPVGSPEELAAMGGAPGGGAAAPAGR